MGCVLIGVFLVPGAVKRFGKKPVYLGRLALWAVGDVLKLLLRTSSLLFVLFFLHGVFRHGVCEQPELGTGTRIPLITASGKRAFVLKGRFIPAIPSRAKSAALAGSAGIMLTQIGCSHAVQSWHATWSAPAFSSGRAWLGRRCLP